MYKKAQLPQSESQSITKMMALSLAAAFLASVWAMVSSRLFNRTRLRYPLPPGPKRLPIIGNLRDVNRIDKPLWLAYADWSKIYGDIFYLEILGEPMVILNSAKAIDDIFEKRSANYSDRPPMYMVNELMGWAWDFAHMRYSDRWRLHRKTFHQYFQPRQVPEFYPILRESASSLLTKLLHDPEDFIDHVRHHAGSIILKVVYGHQMQSKNDHYVNLADKAVKGLSQAIAHGSFLVDFAPILSYIPSWFPGATFKKKAEFWAHDSTETRDGPWVELKKSYDVQDNGTSVPCFATYSLEKFKNSKHMEEVIKNCSGVAFVGKVTYDTRGSYLLPPSLTTTLTIAAGADTTVSTISSAILALLLQPEVQTKVQEELDRVVGRSRLPNFDDRTNLPYLEAVLTESLRWNPVSPLSLPHRSMNDDVYNGYFIPSGSTVVGNSWSILHNPEFYPDPLTFIPERFLPKEGKELPPDPSLYVFGFGRRICPGRYLALNSAWIAIAALMATYRLSKRIDTKTGKEIEPVVDYSEGIVWLVQAP
ncbi:cytochrome P450 [Rhodocollybia butyracea]|uniref:Cytochrome P450 n=1 Tax=Rhodocollybia butyracea TaxID=206335 RepID=A0A9P5PGJ3_9AGAR|nr:cytochrome P450 [Rhodocollybia butyracea]